MFGWIKGLFRRKQHVDASGVVDGSGMRVEASAGFSKSELPKSTDIVEPKVLDATEVTFKCGHAGPRRFAFNLYGLDSKPFDDRKKCMNCRLEESKKVIIRCVLCGLPIIPGEPVVAYHENSRGIRKDIGRKVGDMYLGCLRVGCCPSAGFFAGGWDGVAFRPAFAEGSIAAHTMATGKATVVNL
jgi:hypothetical protein